MSNLVQFTTARKTSRAELTAAWLDGGEIRLYDDAATRLVTFEIPNPAGEVADGVFTGGTIAIAMIAETGIADYATVYDSAGEPIFNATVGLTGGGALVQLDNLNLAQGASAQITSFSIAEQ